MNKQELLDILNNEIEEYKNPETKEDNFRYHLMALFINYIDNNFENFANEDIEKMVSFDFPLLTIYEVFYSNQFIEDLFDETINILLTESETEQDEEIDYEEDDNDLPNYENV